MARKEKIFTKGKDGRWEEDTLSPDLLQAKPVMQLCLCKVISRSQGKTYQSKFVHE